MRGFVVLLCFLLPLVSPAARPSGQTPGKISGQVVDPEGRPLSEALVHLLEKHLQTRTDAEGRFSFADLEPGRYTIKVDHLEWGLKALQVDLKAGEERRVPVALDRDIHGGEDIVVTASPHGTLSGRLAQDTEVLTGSALADALAPTLGETLEGTTGVTSTGFGPGAGRPVIRGMGEERVKTLSGGLDSGDAATISPDHQVAANMLNATAVEVIKGPATLLYGGGAIGGVVNVKDDHVPVSVPWAPLAGQALLSLDTATDLRLGALRLEGGGGRFAWHLGAGRHRSGDLDIPGFAEHQHDGHEEGGHQEDEAFGTLPNSFVDTDTFSFGAAYIGERGRIGAGFSRLDSFYGVPGHEAHGEEEHEDGFFRNSPDDHDGHEDEGVAIDLKQERFELQANWLAPVLFFRSVSFKAAHADYGHQELEGGEVGTRFDSEVNELRLEAVQKEAGSLRGTLGVSWYEREFRSIGEEAVAPHSLTRRSSVFAVEEVVWDHLTLQFGARLERGIVRNLDDPMEAERRFSGASLAAGAIVELPHGFQTALNLTRSTRFPTAEELYSHGPHLATGSFEIGNPSLNEEYGTGLEWSLRHESETFHGSLSLYRYDFEGYIFAMDARREIDHLPVYQYTQEDADFRGGELELGWSMIHTDPHHLTLEAAFDWVEADLDSGEPLPRIPPRSLGLGLRYEHPKFWAYGEYRRVSTQNRVARDEEPTEGYAMWNGAVGLRLFRGRFLHEIILKGQNLGDEEGRNHVSYLKEVAPMAGRNVTLSYRLVF